MSSSAITGPIFTDVRRSPSGSAAAPSWSFNDSQGTGVYLVSADVLGLSTAGVQRVVVDSAGNVGIGTASPGTKLEIAGGLCKPSGIGNSTARPALVAGTQFHEIRASGANAAADDGFLQLSAGGGTNAGTKSYIQLSGFSTVGDMDRNISFGTSGAERMRILPSGDVLVGASTAPSSSVPGVQIGRPGATLWISANAGTASYAHFAFLNANGVVGSIAVAGLSTAYNTNSDYRLKEDVQPMVAALSRVAALKPCTYKWKADGSEGEGFIAHELAEVCPTAVTGEKDAVNEDGSIKVQGIDPSKLVGLLVAAIQELEARLAALEAK